MGFHDFAPPAVEPVERSAPELAVFAAAGLDAGRLARGVAQARQGGVALWDAILAGGLVAEHALHARLADHLGLPFRPDGAVPLAREVEALGALARRRARLADGTCLVAPDAALVRILLAARNRGNLRDSSLVITTPRAFERLAIRSRAEQLARRASLALPAIAPHLSARDVHTGSSAAAAVLLCAGLVEAGLMRPDLVGATMGLLFLAGTILRAVVAAAGLPEPRDEVPPPRVPDHRLPRYSVLVPLHDEPDMVGPLLRNLASLDYPAAKIEILVLVEAQDHATRQALAAAVAHPSIRVVVVPPGAPRTKPRALNFGLMLARGEIVTVYDAEDRPHRGQLREAAARFAGSDRRLACLQAPLAILPSRRLVARLFALEYATLFDLFNPGLARLGLPVALGGTSNHFRASVLRDIGGWDAWNVTEDADLGLRLARYGHRVGMLRSPTWEEAPQTLRVWFRQRRRWTKGWLQVALVLGRDPSAWRDLGPGHALVVALLLVNLVLGPLVTPAILVAVVLGLASGGLDGWLMATIATSVPLTAAGVTLWCGFAGARARGLGALAALVPLLLPYQLLVAAAAWGGLVDLVVSPYHWRKTPHGAAALATRPGWGRRRANPDPSSSA